VAAGLVGAGSGSDGGASIRVPAAYCGLFGLKPQRGRVSTAPLPDHWHGMTMLGWVTRSVADSALLFDLTGGSTELDRDRAPQPPRPFAEAAATPPGRLRIAVTFTFPPGMPGVQVDEEVRRAVLETADLLRSLGHEVVERDPPYGPEAWAAAVRVVHGIAEEALSLPRWERLDRRWRRVARLGALIPESLVEQARAAESRAWARLGPFFDQHDVLLTPVTPEPPIETGRWEGRSATWVLTFAWRLVPFTAPWNFTGQPAAAVPAGWTSRGWPLSAQLIGRPNDEGTLLSLAAQLEAERPWDGRRPPIS
jgi:amidase